MKICLIFGHFNTSNSFNAVARKHQLRIAKQTIKNPYLALLGGMSLEDAERIVMESKK